MSLRQEEVYKIFQRMSDPSLKASLPTCQADMKTFKAGFPTLPQTLKEVINYRPSAICLHRDNFFVNLNEKVSNGLISGGIIQYWYSYLLDFEIVPLDTPLKKPKVFAAEDLSFGFFVWLYACAISASVFVAEVFYVFIKNRTKKLVQSCFGLYSMLRFFTSERNVL